MPVADRRLYLNNDRTKVVEEGDADAGSLLAAEGDELTADQVKQYGIKFDTKAVQPAANKAEKPAEDKGLRTG